LLLLRLEGRLFFANVGTVGQKMQLLVDDAKPKVVALHLRGVTDIEYTALKTLTQAEKRLRGSGVSLWLVGLNPRVLAMVRRSPLGEALGHEAMQFNLEMTVAKYMGL
jgi:MFS superfamily sulfate permease-like transporter